MSKDHVCLIAIGKTNESSEGGEGFKKYIGVGSSSIVAVNPTKAELEKIFGTENVKEPQYVVDGPNGKEARITFIVKTDPDACNGIELYSRLMFTLRNVPDYNSDQSSVRVIDRFGNTTRVNTDEAKAKRELPANYKIDHHNYRMAAFGEADLVFFLKQFLVVPTALEYSKTTKAWSLKANAEDGRFELDHMKDFFNGDFSDIKAAIARQPNNKVKLLYGVRTTEDGKQYQTVCTREGYVLRNSAGPSALEYLEEKLHDDKKRGAFPNIEYAVQDLQEWKVQPTNLNEATPSKEGMPWES